MKRKRLLRNFRQAFELLVIAFSLVILLAYMCQHYQVYIPGIALLIPKNDRPLPPMPTPSPVPSIVIKEEVVIIDNGDEEKSVPPTDSILPTPLPTGLVEEPKVSEKAREIR